MVYALLVRAIGMRAGVKGRIVAAVVAAWMSTVLAAVVCAGELAASGMVAWRVVFPAMAGVHALIGIGEGVITGLVLAAIGSVRPELLAGDEELRSGAGKGSYQAVMAYGMLAAVGVAVFVAPFASPLPDGLERTAERLGFKVREAGSEAGAPLAEYKLPGVGSPLVATAVAGVLGTITVFGIGLLTARVLVPRKQDI